MKYLRFFGCIIAFICLFTLPVSAQVNLGTNEGSLLDTARTQAGFANATDTTLASNLGQVVRFGLSLVGTGFLLLTIYAGITWMTARGDESKVEKSQAVLRSAVIGLAITLAAYSITTFIVPAIVRIATTPSASVGAPRR